MISNIGQKVIPQNQLTPGAKQAEGSSPVDVVVNSRPADDAVRKLAMLAQAGRTTAAAATALNPNDPQSGIRCGSFLRPDPLFNDKTQLVVHAAHTPNNPSGVVEIPHGEHPMIETSHLLTADREVLIGFGQPKVCTMVPNAAGGYQKLDAYPFFEKKSQVVPADVLESGVFIRPRNLPDEAITSLQSAMASMAGHRAMTSTRANAKMLSRAGFTCGGKKLDSKALPLKFFLGLVDHGLEYRGQPVKFDIVSTTTATLDEHFRKVINKEISSPIDAIKGSDRDDTPVTGGPAPSAPVGDPAPPANDARIRLRNSRPNFASSVLRSMLGAHILWEALPDQPNVDIDKFLPVTLMDKFHAGEPLSTVDKLKGALFTPSKVKLIRSCMAHSFDEGREFSPDQVATMLRIPGEGEEAKPDKDGLIKYNLVICGNKSGRGNRVVIARLDVKHDKADDLLSKHVLISGYDQDVRFAGELWAERYTKPDGTEATRIHINNNSGTYRPSPDMAEAAANYLRAMMPGVEIVSHATGGSDAPPKGKPDYIRDYAVAPEQVDSLKALNGMHVTLHDKQGNEQRYAIHHFSSVQYDMEFMDTPQRGLLANNGLLRARTHLKKDGENVKSITVESKIPAKDSAYQTRVGGAEFDSADAWHAARGQILATDSQDSAVKLARSVVGTTLPLDTVVWKHTQRELFFVTPTFPPVVGRLDPEFLVCVDTNTVRNQPNGEHSAPFVALQPQIFTKLPWTKNITPARVEKYEDLCGQLAAKFNVKESTETQYAEAIEHLPAASKP